MTQPEDDVTLPPRDGSQDATLPPRSEPSNSAPSQPQRIGEYEIECEIARGGMGIVYRATHRRLARTVALKMILAGQFASEEAVRRFQLEAASAAQLEHSGIVPIYDVGEFEGHHFFSMKFVDGPALSDLLPQLKSDVRAGVRLLIQIARAIHFAHQRGILHRDLKPANILIDQESGHPIVTDFGLAKQVEGDSQLTNSGAIVGTPGYMPPEQASGKGVTIAADVYSLGAILFELVTGQPPFRGDTPLETLMAVMDCQDPPRVSSIEKTANRDLEAIIVKAMQIEPSQRYVSAAGLADDLQAWLDGRPLTVRPPSLGNVIQQWFRQHARVVVCSLLVGAVAGLVVGLFVYYIFMARITAMESTVYEQLGVPRPLFARELPLQTLLGQGQGSPITTWLQYLLVAGLGLVGFFNAWLSKPENRAAAAASGMMAGFMVSLTGFAVGVGWLVTHENVVSPIQGDIFLLAQAAFDESDAELKPAQRALFYRYPKLRDLDPPERMEAMRALIASNQRAAIPVGLWGGMTLMFLLGLLPCVLGTSLAAALFWADHVWWRALLKYSEIVVAVSFAALFFMLFYVGGIFGIPAFRPVLWKRMCLIGVPLLASFAAFKAYRLPIRFGLLAASVVSVVFYVQEAAENRDAVFVARRHIAAGEFSEAIEFLEQQIDGGGASYDELLCVGILQCYMGDFADYRETASLFLTKNAGISEPNSLNWMAFLSLLHDQNNPHMELAVEIATVIDASQDNQRGFAFAITKALAALRRNQPKKALLFLDKFSGTDNFNGALAIPIRLLAQRQIGGSPENLAAELEKIPEFPIADDGRWVGAMCFEILRRQALNPPD